VPDCLAIEQLDFEPLDLWVLRLHLGADFRPPQTRQCGNRAASSRSSRWLPAIRQHRSQGQWCRDSRALRRRLSRHRLTHRGVSRTGLVIRLERRVVVLDRLPPPPVPAIQSTVARSPSANATCGAPAQRLQLGGIERVPSIVADAVRDRSDERRRLLRQLEDAPGQLHVGDSLPPPML